MKKNIICSVALILFLISAQNELFSQAEKVRVYLKMVAQGKVDEVKKVIPDMLAEYPDDPGVQLLHGVVIDDAYRAVDIYEKIVKKFPDSEFADEAYWRIVQFYAVKGDTGKAMEELENYRKKFPNSGYLNPATDVVRSAVRIAKSNPRNYILNLDKQLKNEDLSAPPKKEAPVEKQEIKVVQTPAPAQTKQPETEKPVEKIAIKEKPTTQHHEKPKADEKDARYGLQVGVYSTHEAAKAETERFKSLRLKAEILPKKVDGATMYAVVIGDYSTKESAEAAKNVVQQQCNCNPIIYKK